MTSTRHERISQEAARRVRKTLIRATLAGRHVDRRDRPEREHATRLGSAKASMAAHAGPIARDSVRAAAR
jgi:hypothetical protein